MSEQFDIVQGAKATLQNLEQENSQIVGLALVDFEGNPVFSTLSDEVDMEALATIVFSTFEVGEKSIQEFGRNKIRQMVLKAKENFLVLFNIADEFVLLVLTSDEIHPPELLPQVRDASEEIMDLLNVT